MFVLRVFIIAFDCRPSSETHVYYYFVKYSSFCSYEFHSACVLNPEPYNTRTNECLVKSSSIAPWWKEN